MMCLFEAQLNVEQHKTKKIIKNLAEPANGQALYNRYINLSINCHAFGIEICTQRSKTVHSLAGASSCQSTCLPIQNPASNGRKIVCNYCVRTARSANAVGGGEWGRRLYCTFAYYMRLYLHKNVKNTHKLHRSQASCAESVLVNKNLKRLTNFMNEINKYKFQNWSKSVFDVDFCAASLAPATMNVKHKCYAAAGRQAMGRRPWHFTTPPTKIMQTQYMTAVFMGWLINILWRRVLCAVCTFDDLANARARAHSEAQNRPFDIPTVAISPMSMLRCICT